MPTRATAVLRTEVRLFAREPASLFWILVFPTALLCVIGAIPDFREPDPALGGLRTIDLYLPTVILLSMIMASLMAMPPVVFAYRESGVLRRLATTPVGPAAVLGAQVLVHAVAVLVSSVMALVVGWAVFDIELPGSLLGYALAYLLVLLASFSLGAVVTALSPNGRVGTAVGTILFFPAMFTAGVYLPVRAMPDALREGLGYTPLTAAAEAMTETLEGGFPGGQQLLVVAVWAALLSLVAVRTFRWE
ncbi:ABC transporter permease [Nocardioides sp. zg-536]|uniref:Transport permease protein n=1 Tax=Nocardioides faecalis TaxID=2803858 RepID=A0A938Y7T7_9ACTN|nr:ABC transporter permease [Nocardioides faecalis]MBS4752738.1 ABC transporter permease [Nocardioides faecalis]QVI60676.1 ABC transporter permease [Nocardioides faecalis]